MKSLMARYTIITTIIFFLSAAYISAQTTFTANVSGNWTSIAWVKAGPSAASYPGQPGYEFEIHDVVINGAVITVTLNTNIVSSVRNVTLTNGTLNISSNTLSMTGNLIGAGTLSFTSGALIIAGDNSTTGTFNFGTGTIHYNGGAQSVRGTTYYNLVISGTNYKTISGNTIVNNNFTINTGTLNTSTSDFTVVNGVSTIYTGGQFATGVPAGTITFKNLVLSGGTIFSSLGGSVPVNITGNLLVNNSTNSSFTKIDLIVTGTTQIQTDASLSFNGSSGSGTFNGLVTVNGGWYNNADWNCTFHNGLTVNNPFFQSGTGLYVFDTNSQTISGTSPVTFDTDVSLGSGGMVLTNSTNVTITGNLTGGNPSTWRNASGSVLNYESANAPMGGVGRVLDASANANTVNYYANLSQAVKDASYFDLTLSGSGTKTLQGATAVNGDLFITGSVTLLTNQFQVTGNSSGILAMDSGTTLLIGNPGDATNVLFPTGYTTANILIDPNTLVSYQANVSQTISAAPPFYGNLSTATSGTKTLGGNITVVGDLSIGAGTTLDASLNNYNINIQGSWLNSGTFSAEQGKVIFSGTIAQTITSTLTGAETFYDLELNTVGFVTTTADLFISNELTMTNGNIEMSGNSLLLGVSGVNPGTLSYTTGWINGTISRWASSIQNNTDLLFPVGDNVNGNRFMNLNFTNITAAGILTLNFVPIAPVPAGLPLSENDYSMFQLFPEGYWDLQKDGTFSFSNSFNLDVIPSGFVTFPIDTNTRVVSKFNTSDWFLNGSHVAGSSAVLHRINLSSFTNDYAVAFAEPCDPVLVNCPADIITNNSPGDCGSNVTWTPPSFSVPCSKFTLTNNYNPDDYFNVGITQVVYYLWNGPVLKDSCKFNITVIDNEDPVVICKNTNLYIDASGSATLQVSDIDNGSSDNCSLILNPDRTDFDCSDVGLTIPVLLTGTDPSGNFATCTAQVTVLDTVRPTIITKPYTVMLDPSGNGTLLPTDVDNGTYDNCTSVVLSVFPNTFSCGDQGTQNVLFTAVDLYGNIATVTIQVTVVSSLTINSAILTSCDLAGPFALYKADVTGGDGNYTYLWDGLDDSVDPFISLTGVFPFVTYSNTSTEEKPFFNNLMPDGTYTIRLTVTDGNGCVDTMSLVIVKAGLMYNNISTTYSTACEGTTVTYSVNYDPSATYNWGVENGTILTSPLDTSKIDVLWNTGITQGVVIATTSKINLAGDPCESVVIDTVAIEPIPSPVFDNPVTDVCSNSVTTYNLTEPYSSYIWTVNGGVITGGGTGSDFVTVMWGTGPAGKVTVTVESTPGCANSTFVDITIHDLSGSITSLTDVTCNGAANGTVTVEASPGSGTPPYEYSLDGAPYQASGTYTNLSPGAYLVTIRDALLCTYDVGFSISQPAILTATMTTTDVDCYGDYTGTITVIASGGTAPYEYSVDGGPYQASDLFTGLDAGPHTVIVRDLNLCTFSQNVNISQPAAALGGAITSQTGVLCFGDNNGTLTISGSGGTAPYEYSLDGGPFQGSGSFGSLAAGPHTVTVRDSKLCTVDVPVTIGGPLAPLGGSITTQTDVDCFGNSTGSVTVEGSDGTGPYDYSLDGGTYQGSGTFTNLSAGNYTVTVRDASLCLFNVPVTISEPSALSGSIASQTDIVCYGDATGQVTVTASGGTSPYQYSLDGGPFQGSPTFMGLIAGSYTVTIQDANMCTFNVPVSITQPLTALAGTTVVTDVVCVGASTGSIDLTVSGETPPCTFLWSNGATTEDISGLVAGTYTVTITDASGCTAIASGDVNEPASGLAASVIVSDVMCFGDDNGSIDLTVTGGTTPYSFIWSNGETTEDISGLAGGSYSVLITDVNGCTTNASGDVNAPADSLTMTTIAQDNRCAPGSNGLIDLTVSGGTIPYTYLWSSGATTEDIMGLAGGIYSVLITDANGCMASTSDTIYDVFGLPLIASTVVTDILCYGDATGAIDLTVSGDAPFTFNWSNSATTEDINGLIADTYSVTITDNYGCTVVLSDDVTEPEQLSIEEIHTDATCPGEPDGSITLNITGGTQPYNILWNDGDSLLTRPAMGNYTYSVVVTDSNSCAESLDITVGIANGTTCIEVPEVITPNGDGKNDTWIIKNIGLTPNAELLVYNRWGKLVYQTKNIAANPWDGKYNGKLVPTDSYHYILYLNDGSKARKGVITVIR